LVADRRWPARTAAAIALVPLAAIFSIAIEFGAGVVSQDGRRRSNDVAAETLGGVIGIVLWLAVGQLTITWLRQYSSGPAVPRRSSDGSSRRTSSASSSTR
jgi:hypothetical protein